jgi:hypothetical protein
MLLLGTRAAYAYIDPGTATLVLQGIVGAVAAGMLFFRQRMAQLVSFVLRRRPSISKGDETKSCD